MLILFNGRKQGKTVPMFTLWKWPWSDKLKVLQFERKVVILTESITNGKDRSLVVI